MVESKSLVSQCMMRHRWLLKVHGVRHGFHHLRMEMHWRMVGLLMRVGCEVAVGPLRMRSRVVEEEGLLLHAGCVWSLHCLLMIEYSQ